MSESLDKIWRARKPKGLNRIAKVWEQVNQRSKQDRQSLGARKPKGLNRIVQVWEQETKGSKQDSQSHGRK